jgi:hypothetical protein
MGQMQPFNGEGSGPPFTRKNWEGLRPLPHVRSKNHGHWDSSPEWKDHLHYDEKGRRLTNLVVGSGPKDGLQGFTSATVSVRFGSVISIYDEKGRRLSVVSAGR